MRYTITALLLAGLILSCREDDQSTLPSHLFMDSRIETGNQVCGSDTITSVFATSVADGDVQGDFYLPVKDENNFVSITSYNDQTEEIEGTFQITFAIELEDEPPYKNDITAPDTIRLTQGRFSAIVREN